MPQNPSVMMDPAEVETSEQDREVAAVLNCLDAEQVLQHVLNESEDDKDLEAEEMECHKQRCREIHAYKLVPLDKNEEENCVRMMKLVQFDPNHDSPEFGDI